MSKMSTSRSPIVVLDTNMVMLMASGVPVLDHIEEELEAKPRFVVIRPVYEELVKIANSTTGTTRKQALFALELINRFCDVIDYELRDNETVDNAIVRYALEKGAIVATNDRALRKKLREHGIPEAYFREEGRRVKVEGYYK